MAELVRRQDLPPPGGYQPIKYIRQPAKLLFSAKSLFAGYVIITAGSMYLYSLNHKKLKKEKIESRSAKLAMYPLLLAERDREFLKQVNRNREEEAKLMANVEGWEVGTWYGEPIYKTVSKNTWIEPSYDDYYAHCDSKDYWYARDFKFYF